MAAKVKDGVLRYVDEQVDALHQHVPAALGQFDETGVHRARVATRRLKAALDLLKGLSDDDAFKPLNRAGRKLRRLLGPLRDADVMIKHAGAYAVADRYRPALTWLQQTLHADRETLRGGGVKGSKSADKRLKAFDAWWTHRRAIELRLSGLDRAIAARLVEQADTFATAADEVAGIATRSDVAPLDVHEVRIDGKALRYTFELADAQGVRVPKRVFKTFKDMQESLGTWHDFVVLAETTLRQWTQKQLALHDPVLAAGVLDLAKLFLKDAEKALTHFKTRWKRSGRGILKVIDRLRPPTDEATVSATVSESQTDPNPPPTEAPTAPVTPS